jgi:hypothetical protein
MTQAQKFLAYADHVIAGIFKDAGEVQPMWHLVQENGPQLALLTPWNNAREKDAAADYIRAIIKERKIVRYAFMAETWMVQADPADVESAVRLARRGQLSKHQDRREALIVQVEDRDTKEQLSRVRFILRPEHGKATLSPPHQYDGEMVAGRFCKMFD